MPPKLQPKRTSLADITADGFRLTDFDGRPDYALSSLEIAVRAYVSTSHAIHGSLHLTEPGTDPEDQKTNDWNLFSRYQEAAFETIIHLQHFAELVVKQALRSDHELLVVVAQNHHSILHDLIHGRTPTPESFEDLLAVEASVALQRACVLLGESKLDASYRFILPHRPFLEKLNGLRNRLWHRGTFVLRYRALDELFGQFALPFIAQALEHGPYKKFADRWKPKALACGLDPIEEIAREFRGASWSLPKVAFLKELARAAYENPLESIPFFEADNERIRRTIEDTVEKVGPADLASIERVASCPVCGMKALLVYEDSHWDEDTPIGDFTWLAKCEGCTLELRDSYGNPSDYGWTNLEDYWWQRSRSRLSPAASGRTGEALVARTAQRHRSVRASVRRLRPRGRSRRAVWRPSRPVPCSPNADGAPRPTAASLPRTGATARDCPRRHRPGLSSGTSALGAARRIRGLRGKRRACRRTPWRRIPCGSSPPSRSS